MAGSGTRRIDIEEIGDITIATFMDKKILDETNIQIIGSQMFGLVDEDQRLKIILDFSNVEYLSSAALGKLITMEKKVKRGGGESSGSARSVPKSWKFLPLRSSTNFSKFAMIRKKPWKASERSGSLTG